MKKIVGYGKRGWIMIIAFFLINFAGISIINSVNIMAPFLAETKGWNAVLITSSFTIGGLVSVLFQFVVGRIMIKHSSKKISLIFSIIFIAVTLILGCATTQWMFVFGIAAAKICTDVWGIMANGTMLANWFPTRKGKIMGITTFGIPLGAGVGMAIMGSLISKGTMAPYIPFLIFTIISFLLQQIFLSDHPEQKECYPDNDQSFDKEELQRKFQEEIEAQKRNPWTVKRLLMSKDFWLFLIPVAFILMGSTGVMTQATSVLMSVDADFYAQYGTLVLALVSVVACGGSFLCGVIDDKFGTKIAVLISSVCMFLACILCMTNTLIGILLGFAFLAVFMGGGSNFQMSGVATYWGRSGFTRAFGVLTPVSNIISSLGPFLIASIAATTGKYSISFGFMAVLSAIGVICSILVKKERVSIQEEEYRKQDGLDEIL